MRETVGIVSRSSFPIAMGERAIMKAERSILLFVVLALAAGQIGRADATADARKAIQGEYRKLNTAFQKRDLDAFVKGCTPDCKIKSQQGTFTIDQWRRMTQPILQTLENVKYSVRIEKVTLKGKDAVVMNTQTLDATLTSPQDNKKHRLHSVEKTKDIWRKTATGWRLRFSETISHRTTLDGKPSPM